jgi:hypothetical protein
MQENSYESTFDKLERHITLLKDKFEITTPIDSNLLSAIHKLNELHDELKKDPTLSANTLSEIVEDIIHEIKRTLDIPSNALNTVRFANAQLEKLTPSSVAVFHF